MRRTGGAALLISASLAFVLATAWLLLTPFIEDDQPLRHLFPPLEWLLLPACLAIATVVSGICLHVGLLVVRDALA
ncbi:hypothetical protein Rsub_11837 [Raphidocelis subcapitata]|uniref:Dolichol phosphate-mannose biosynthesis regulatory protein n=1 Tax=Raphidocelis subcapitata TaxID=307507 RepID=A0A2V0PH23_9CHLO|nr:hypothetical protein Rsub_11837 [Raphidocelis subcapitata]|eukprot:GBF99066.1 hypothetical protein Rsub_11837 [Raphidocelis subcapitata]